MTERHLQDGLYSSAAQEAEALMREEADLETWATRQEAEVLAPFARKLVSSGSEERAHAGLKLALTFSREKNQASAFAQATRNSADRSVCEAAFEYSKVIEDESIWSAVCMEVVRCPHDDIALRAVWSALSFKDETSRNVVLGQAIKHGSERIAHSTLDSAVELESERLLGRLARDGMTSEHPGVRERCVQIAHAIQDIPARNRALRFAESLGLVQYPS